MRARITEYTSRSSLLGELCEHLGEFVPLDEVEELVLVGLQDGAAVAQDGARVPPRLEPLEGQARALRIIQLVLVGRVDQSNQCEVQLSNCLSVIKYELTK